MNEVEATTPDESIRPQSPEALLRALVAAEQSIEPNAQSFRIATGDSPNGVPIRHRGLSPAFRARARADIDALAAEGLIRMRPDSGRTVCDLTEEGRKRVMYLQAAEGGQVLPAGGEHALDWNTEVAPLLNLIGRIYNRAQLGFGLESRVLLEALGRDSADARLGMAFEHLEAAGYVKTTLPSDVSFLPRFFRLEERGLQLMAGWPSGESVAAALVAAISARIETTDSPEEKTKLQGLLESLLDVGNNVLGSILANVLTGQLPT
jgi:hypothetical protein